MPPTTGSIPAGERLFPGVTRFVEAVQNATHHLAFGVTGLVLMAVCVYVVRGGLPTETGFIPTGLALGGAAIGSWQLCWAFVILRAASGGGVTTFVTVVLCVLPVMVVLIGLWVAVTFYDNRRW